MTLENSDELRFFLYGWTTLRSIKYKLITSDGIQGLGKSGLELYSAPFKNSVWLLLFLSLLGTVIFLSTFPIFGGMGRENMKKSADFFWALLWIPLEISWWIFGILMEQPDGSNPNLSSYPSLDKNWRKMKRMLDGLNVWVLVDLWADLGE